MMVGMLIKPSLAARVESSEELAGGQWSSERQGEQAVRGQPLVEVRVERRPWRKVLFERLLNS